MSTTIAISIEHLSKIYCLRQVGTGTLTHDLHRWWCRIYGREDPYLKIGEKNDRSKKGNSDYVYALHDINLEISRGEVLGIIGKNGAGKSTLLKILSKVTGPTTGQVRIKGRLSSLLEVGTGFHPDLTGRENIYMNGTIMGMTRKEIDTRLDAIIDFAGVERYLDTPVKRYSSGMLVRLGFAVAAHLDPDILIVDEVLAVGDAEFQKKAVGKMREISGGGERTVIIVSHNMRLIREYCTSAILLDQGEISAQGKVSNVVDTYLAEDSSGQKAEFLFSDPRNGRAHIQSIRFEDHAGHPCSCFSVGAPWQVRITIAVEERLPAFQTVLCMYTKGYGDILRLTWSEPMEMTPGIHTLIFRESSLILATGVYPITIRIASGRRIQTLDRAVSLHISNAVDQVPNGVIKHDQGMILNQAEVVYDA